MSYARLSEVKVGDFIHVEDMFCAADGIKLIKENEKGLYFECNYGKHYLEGQIVSEEDDVMIGIKSTTHCIFCNSTGMEVDYGPFGNDVYGTKECTECKGSCRIVVDD